MTAILGPWHAPPDMGTGGTLPARRRTGTCCCTGPDTVAGAAARRAPGRRYAATMKVERVPLDSLNPDPKNARRHSARNLDAIRASLERFHQQKPIVVARDGTVVAGNGTLEAARALGWEEVAVVYTDLDGPARAAFAVADNRTAELAEWNDEALADVLESWDDPDLVAAAGYEDDEYQALLEALGRGVEGADMPSMQERGLRAVTMVMTHRDGEVFDEAMDAAEGKDQGEKVAAICREWLRERA